MNNEKIILDYVEKHFKLKTNIFDENDKFDKTSEVYKQIILTKDYEFIQFCNFYFFLVDQRIYNGIDERHIITSTEVWPLINSSKTIILNYIKSKDKTEYQNMSRYLINTFNKELDKYSKELSDELKKIKSSIPAEKRIMLSNSYRDTIYSRGFDHYYGIDFNRIATNLKSINALKDNINEAKILVEDEKRYKFNFWLSLILASVSIVLSILSFIL